jgi:hypothetical protein
VGWGGVGGEGLPRSRRNRFIYTGFHVLTGVEAGISDLIFLKGEPRIRKFRTLARCTAAFEIL